MLFYPSPVFHWTEESAFEKMPILKKKKVNNLKKCSFADTLKEMTGGNPNIKESKLELK